MGLYAIKDLYSGMELLFDYDGDNTLEAQFNWITKSQRLKKTIDIEIDADEVSDMGFHIEIW